MDTTVLPLIYHRSKYVRLCERKYYCM